MIVTLDLTPDVEAALTKKAEAEGIPVSEFVQDLVRSKIERTLPGTGEESPAYELPYEEWHRRFQAFLEGNSGNTVVLPAEAYNRESIYGDHGV